MQRHGDFVTRLDDMNVKFDNQECPNARTALKFLEMDDSLVFDILIKRGFSVGVPRDNTVKNG